MTLLKNEVCVFENGLKINGLCSQTLYSAYTTFAFNRELHSAQHSKITCAVLRFPSTLCGINLQRNIN